MSSGAALPALPCFALLTADSAAAASEVESSPAKVQGAVDQHLLQACLCDHDCQTLVLLMCAGDFNS